MSQYQAYRRIPVPPQAAQQLQVTSIPAPTRGLIESENFAFMQPGGAIVLDNWKPTLRSIQLRGGCARWCDLHALDTTVPPIGSPLRKPVVSAFEYASGNVAKMFAAQQTKLFDVTFTVPVLVKSGQTSGNYCASQLATMGGDFLLAVNDTGDYPLRFNGTSWATLNGTAPANWANSTAYAIGARAMDTTDRSYWKAAVAHTSAAAGTFAADRTSRPTFWVPDVASDGISWITGPAGSGVVSGGNLTYVWKYRNRWFFIEGGSMNAWYLPTNAVGGTLQLIPLSGAASQGGKLLFGATWSIDAGDGIDDKCVFCTDHGELLIFTGSNPSDVANWRQEGRYQVPAPMGMNAHVSLGGDLLIATVEGIVPTSAAISKTSGDLDLAMITKNIKVTWRQEALTRNNMPWTMERWDEYGGLFVTWPGGTVGNRYCGVVNSATGAWARFTGWDATCWIRLRGDMFFGTQDGLIQQADRGGNDDGAAYVATMVGGWEMFQSPAQTMVWRQARANFTTKSNANFNPQLSACTDYVITIPPSLPPVPDPGVLDVWDQGVWGPTPTPTPPTSVEIARYAQWDQHVPTFAVMRNTGWVSIGLTGFSHAPVLQVTMNQRAKPDVELISISATYEHCGVNV